MLQRAVRRLLSAVLLAIGVSVVLFVIFDSGVLGDPALRRLGRRASPQDLGEARARSGVFRSYEPGVIGLEVVGPPQRFSLRADGNRLRIDDRSGRPVLDAELSDRTVAELVPTLDGRALGGGWVLLARDLRESLDASGRPAPRSAAGEAAEGIAVALGSAVQVLDAGAPVQLGWAERRPAALRLAQQVGRLLVLDFGVSDATRLPLGRELWQRGLRSLALTLPAFLLATVLAVFLALFTAALRGRFDRVLAWASLAGLSVSSLAYVLFLRQWLVADLGWFPAHGWGPPYWNYLALPVLIWVIVALWPELRFYRTIMLDEVGRAYVRTARAKGLSTWSVLRCHVLPNALVPLLTQVVVALPFLVLGSLLLESFFGIPGLGSFAVDAVDRNDQAALRAVTFVFALAYLAAQWLTDLLYPVVDPRMRSAR